MPIRVADTRANKQKEADLFGQIFEFARPKSNVDA